MKYFRLPARLYIERTTNVGDNISINIGDQLTYTIKIKNKSNASKTQNTNGGYTSEATSYQNIVIQEWILGLEEETNFNSRGEIIGDANITTSSSSTTVNCTKQASNERKYLRCKIDTLAAGEEVAITYTVKVMQRRF